MFELSSTKYDFLVTWNDEDGNEQSEIVKDIPENEIFKYLKEHGYPKNANASILI